jgi:hypothetical protein
MYNSIILTSGLFGSIYIFSKSLELINKSIVEKHKIPRHLHVINGLTFLISGYICIYNLHLMKKHI